MATLAPLPAARTPGGAARRPVRFDLPRPARIGMSVVGGALTAVSAIAIGRLALGLSAVPLREVAIGIHLAAVLPAIPLGLYVLLARKGDARHRMLGKVWMAMMLVTALSAIFIRHLNDGGFSWLHIFVPVVIVSMVRAINAARTGNIAAHKRGLVTMFVGALLIPGLFSFMPGRMMWAWLLA